MGLRLGLGHTTGRLGPRRPHRRCASTHRRTEAVARSAGLRVCCRIAGCTRVWHIRVLPGRPGSAGEGGQAGPLYSETGVLPRSTQSSVGHRASRRRAAELGCRCQPALCAAAWPPPAIGAAAAQNCACVLGQASGGTVRARAYLGRHRWDTDRTGAGGWSLNPRRWTSARRFSSAVLARSTGTAPQDGSHTGGGN